MQTTGLIEPEQSSDIGEVSVNGPSQALFQRDGDITRKSLLQ